MFGLGWEEILILVLIGMIPILLLIWVIRNFSSKK
jgi:hypothetical protein